MSSDRSRRSFMAGLGAVVGGTALQPTVAGATALPDRYLVDTATVSASEIGDVEVVHRLDPIDFLVVRGSGSELPDHGVAPDVAYTLDLPTSARRLDVSTPPSDPLYELQWDKQAQSIPSVHETTRGEGTRVAVIDSGVDPDHPDLAHAVNAELSRNFTDDGGDFSDVLNHGTHVTGILAANADNGAGVVGTAPDTDVVALRTFTEDEEAAFGDVIAAMTYAAEVGCDVVNMSLGAYPLELTDPEVVELQTAFERASINAMHSGTLMIAAAGNDSANLHTDGDVVSLPNEAPNIMSVSATSPVGFRWDDDESVEDPFEDLRAPPHEPAFYTNYGATAIDVSAPGGGGNPDDHDSDLPFFYDFVLSTIPDDYGFIAGTSMAAPQVAGTAALVKSVAPSLSPSSVRGVINTTATYRQPVSFHVNGHLDVPAAVRAAESFA